MPSIRHGKNMSANEEKAYDSNTNRRLENGIVDSSDRLASSASSWNVRDKSSSNRRRNRSRSRSPYRVNRSRSPYRADRRRSRSPYRAGKERSRSPYRKTEEKGSEKRRFEGDHYNASNASDSRRFKAHYEEETPVKSSAATNHVSNHGRSGEKHMSGSGYGKHSTSYEREPTGTKDGKMGGTLMQGAASQISGTKLTEDSQEKSNTAPADTTTPEISEAELIEQRRRRREAIKAKHRLQPTLLIQALESTPMSIPTTPTLQSSNDATSQHSPTSILDSPRTPDTDSILGSPRPFMVENEEELLKRPTSSQAVEQQGPSAADYDPSMDMQEDRKNLVQQGPLSAQMPKTAIGAERPAAEVDMFADEDDMFADAPVTKSTAEAKALDESLLDTWDYPDGHIRVIIGELLDSRYAIKQQIGKGTFATVVRAEEVSSGRLVAIKIACKNDTMYKAGTQEMDFLSILNTSDPEDKRHIIQLLAHFEHKGHLCLVFENLHADLRETLKKHGRNVGLNLIALRSFAHSILQALLHMQRNEILHADLKPDNILISERMNQLKICDFGTATKLKDAEVTPYLVSRFYRAPEVMLGIPLDFSIDMWSIGCTLFELYTGRILFTGADNNQMLRSIQECRGKIPIRMLKRATLADKHFDEFGNFISIERDRSTGQLSYRQLNLMKVAPKKDLRSRILDSTPGDDPTSTKQVREFVDLLDKCLQLDPARRISPADALRHGFVTQRASASNVPEKKRPVIMPGLAPTSIR